ncbi:Protein of unknown function [Gryllus bimaculatus]|nr:Protein of unknown function [Gryllus bimaculatus]
MIKIECGKVTSRTLVNTGSVKSVMAEELHEELVEKGAEVLVMSTNNTKVMDVSEKKSHPIMKQDMFECVGNGRPYHVIYLVVKKLIYSFIIGIDFLEEHGVIVNMEEQGVLQRGHCG